MFHVSITTGEILQQRSDKEIFEFYLQREVNENDSYYAPYRNDSKPSCTFSYMNGKWWFRDWSLYDKPFDCFKFVEKLYNLSFKQAIEKIYFDLDLKILDQDIVRETKVTVSEKTKPTFTIVKKDFTKTDIDYLKQYGINKHLCNKYNVFSIQSASVNGYYIYNYQFFDPCLGYYLGKDDRGQEKWKLYFYRRIDNRFLTNTSRIQGWIQIPKTGDLLINTKSLKDVMVLDKLGYASIAPQSESFMYYDYIIDHLKSRFNTIVSLYDPDPAGIKYANKLNEEFDIPYVFLEQAKDVSDLIKTTSILNGKQTIDNIFKPFKNTS